MNEPGHLDLFSGIGGFSLGFEAAGFRTIAFAEVDPEASLVLEHHWPGVPNLGDIRRVIALLRRFGTERTAELRRLLAQTVVVTGGVPCQPASALGQMRGTADERWLWPEFIRLVCQIRALRPAGAPFYAVAENPPSLLTLDGGRAWNGIVSALVASGFDLWWDVFPAAAVGAGHLRERVVLIAANANHGNDRQRCSGSGHYRSAQQAKQVGAGNWTNTTSNAESECQRITPDQINAITGTGNARAFPVRGSSAIPCHSNSARLEGHTGHDATNGQRAESRRPTAPPDLRGRVFPTAAGEFPWWHEAHTGIPVLAHGLSARLVEAATRCTGNSIVPQIPLIIGQAIREQLT